MQRVRLRLRIKPIAGDQLVVSLGEQALLECVDAAGETGDLVLLCGPDAGKTLAEVARSGPDHL